MVEQRRALVDGLKTATPPVDSAREREFVSGKSAGAVASQTAVAPTTTANVARTPLSTKMRTDYSTALKRASLERQLSGVQPNTLQDILEECIGPWLKSNGYLT